MAYGQTLSELLSKQEANNSKNDVEEELSFNNANSEDDVRKRKFAVKRRSSEYSFDVRTYINNMRNSANIRVEKKRQKSYRPIHLGAERFSIHKDSRSKVLKASDFKQRENEIEIINWV